jgi:hypothetical protein
MSKNSISGPTGEIWKERAVHYSPYSKHLSPRLSPPEEGGEGVLKKGKSEEKRYQIFTFIYSTHICTFFPYKE